MDAQIEVLDGSIHIGQDKVVTASGIRAQVAVCWFRTLGNAERDGKPSNVDAILFFSGNVSQFLLADMTMYRAEDYSDRAMRFLNLPDFIAGRCRHLKCGWLR
ncbi:hypothetical protein COCCADRAFT_39590 [Bipolaris zeicola 26-R-13]|uniref:Uncharacterized protein n=1 Tax=Cochliobolus carbonum (strain 26-R-13) TaxID=930089 RepID=W6Y4X3_COCC2|nr:uncharacterized protein COCCADRAFT_39590 [Bipolaris zeicola 26-R-13]EUC30154.1 hypothetical protein COCCADRAFT_39590 [Bipolaris zeicola 26-R-13]